MTMVGTTRHGALKLNVPPGGIPAMRLLKWHAPDLRVECTDDKGAIIMLPLSDIDISHDAIAQLNAARSSYTPDATGVHPVVPAAKAR